MSENSSSNNRPAARPAQNNGQGQNNTQNSNNGSRRPPGRNNRRRHHNNKPKSNLGPNQPRPNPNQNPNNPNQPKNDNRSPLIDRIYEKYQNLLDQHILARKKYHDLFYRADLPQKNKLERHFYSTLKDLRDFEGRLNPAEREIFEKRNNGLSLDTTYSSLNPESAEVTTPPIINEPADPHFMQSQKAVSYKDDREDTVGSKADYEKYKLTH